MILASGNRFCSADVCEILDQMWLRTVDKAQIIFRRGGRTYVFHVRLAAQTELTKFALSPRVHLSRIGCNHGQKMPKQAIARPEIANVWYPPQARSSIL